MDLSKLPPGIPLSMIPAGTPPNGTIPNFVDPPSLRTATLVVAVVLMIIASLFVVMRLADRLREKKFGIEDVFVGLSLLISFAYMGSVFALLKYTRHLWDVPLSWFIDPNYPKLLFVQSMTLGPALFFGKAAILLFYLRVFGIKETVRYLVYAAFLYIFCLYWVNVGMAPYFCAPRPGKPWGPNNILNCGRMAIWGTIQGPMNIFIDMYIFVLPIPVVLGLQLSAKKKFGLLAIFLTAGFAIVASILATYYRFILHGDTTDPTWHSAQLAICIIVENFVVIICGCMPSVASFAKHRFSGLNTIIPTFGSRLLRSKAGTSTAKTGASSGSASTVQNHKGDTKGSYYELNDTVPLNQSYPAKNAISVGASPLAHDEGAGIRRQYDVEQNSTVRQKISVGRLVRGSRSMTDLVEALG